MENQKARIKRDSKSLHSRPNKHNNCRNSHVGCRGRKRCRMCSLKNDKMKKYFTKEIEREYIQKYNMSPNTSLNTYLGTSCVIVHPRNMGIEREVVRIIEGAYKAFASRERFKTSLARLRGIRVFRECQSKWTDLTQEKREGEAVQVLRRALRHYMFRRCIKYGLNKMRTHKELHNRAYQNMPYSEWFWSWFGY